MAGKKKFKIDEVIEAIEKGHTPKDAAKILGCHPDTIRNYADSNERVRRALESERKDLVDIAKKGLRRHLERQEAWAISFTLKTLGKDEGFTERQEITGKDGNSIVVRWDDATSDD
jgi:predicted transcriptional regulator